MKPIRFATLFLVATTIPSHNARGGSFDQLLTRVPAGANALVLIDVKNTLDSPVAQAEGWGKQLELDYVERPIFLPPEANKLVMAAALRPGNDFSRLWELAAMELDEPMSMRSIARSEGGYVDEINGKTAAWTPSDAYFVSLGDRELGVMFPAERQFVSRWVEFAENNREIVLSDYLRAIAQLANERVQILLAVDLKDVVRPHELEENLQDLPAIQKSKLSVPELASVLSTLRGAVLQVAIGKDVQGQLRIDFAADIKPLRPVAKAIVLQALDNLGANAGDLESWRIDFEDRAILMRGPLSKDGQRRVFSVVEIPSTKFSTLKNAGEPSRTTPESKIRESSLTYFRATEVLIKDLRRDLRGNKANAAVMERYARKIDRMPILHVDDELLDYGGQLANTLRTMALSKRQGGIQAGVGTAGMGGGRSNYSSYSYGYGSAIRGGGDRLYAAKQSASERSQIKAGAMAESKRTRVEGFKAIDAQSAAIRRQMTQKYEVEF